jgi:hypothetical protein
MSPDKQMSQDDSIIGRALVGTKIQLGFSPARVKPIVCSYIAANNGISHCESPVLILLFIRSGSSKIKRSTLSPKSDLDLVQVKTILNLNRNPEFKIRLNVDSPLNQDVYETL